MSHLDIAFSIDLKKIEENYKQELEYTVGRSIIFKHYLQNYRSLHKS
ncbi:hypothetical protein IWX83_000316 [Flavobacterium sp. CG_9.1]|uniref:Uncharacterized protein n=1 Tax=Flavobacterium xanthum TaxID=69322 RepID=A0A1M7BNV1_9FLAO|nr:hypothetical protein [Flavobacterium sp. CG_9.1]SHL56728.1 hypothetical protein SAMN05443669_100988 [Flavobacterium xanthum]